MAGTGKDSAIGGKSTNPCFVSRGQPTAVKANGRKSTTFKQIQAILSKFKQISALAGTGKGLAQIHALLAEGSPQLSNQAARNIRPKLRSQVLNFLIKHTFKFQISKYTLMTSNGDVDSEGF